MIREGSVTLLGERDGNRHDAPGSQGPRGPGRHRRPELGEGVALVLEGQPRALGGEGDEGGSGTHAPGVGTTLTVGGIPIPAPSDQIWIWSGIAFVQFHSVAVVLAIIRPRAKTPEILAIWGIVLRGERGPGRGCRRKMSGCIARKVVTDCHRRHTASSSPGVYHPWAQPPLHLREGTHKWNERGAHSHTPHPTSLSPTSVLPEHQWGSKLGYKDSCGVIFMSLSMNTMCNSCGNLI